MLKSLGWLALALWLPAVQAAVIEPYQAKGCRYEGALNAARQPHGHGTWTCQDGRSYQGEFKNGRFDGKGSYTVNTAQEMFLEPFTSDSSKLNHMVLTGMFKQGRAQGIFRVTQNGEPVFIIKFDRGIMQDVQLADKPKKK